MPDLALEPLLSLKQASQTLGLAQVTVRKLVRQGKLVGVRLGSRLLFEPQTLREFVARNRTAPFLRHTVGVEPIQAAIPESADRDRPSSPVQTVDRLATQNPQARLTALSEGRGTARAVSGKGYSGVSE